jgi:hypothetical protein
VSLIDPSNAESDARIVTQYEALQKSGVPGLVPRPGSPAARRFEHAVARHEARRQNLAVAPLIKAQLTPSERAQDDDVARPRELPSGGGGSMLNEVTRQMAINSGNLGLNAQARLLRDSDRLMAGRSVALGGRPADYDPRNPLDRRLYDDEARDQVARAALAAEVTKTAAEQSLANMKLYERAKRDPLIRAALDKAERKAAKRGRKATPADFQRALDKLDAKQAAETMAKASASAGFLGTYRVVNLKAGGLG